MYKKVVLGEWYNYQHDSAGRVIGFRFENPSPLLTRVLRDRCGLEACQPYMWPSVAIDVPVEQVRAALLNVFAFKNFPWRVIVVTEYDEEEGITTYSSYLLDELKPRFSKTTDEE